MNKESIDIMLPQGVDIEDCVGKCEVETGRKLGASFIVTGEVGRIEGQLQLSIRLFSTEDGNLLSQEVVSGSSVRELQGKLKTSAQKLFASLTQNLVASSVESGSTVFLVLNPPNLQLKLNKTVLSKSSLQAKKGGFLLRLKPGKYTLRGSASGYLSQEEEFVLTQGGSIEVRLDLPKELKRDSSCDPKDSNCRGDVQVYTEPAGARLWVDGKETPHITKPSRRDPDKGAVTLTLPPGEHVIEARLPKYLSARGRITLKKDDLNDELRQSPLVLKPNFGSLSITSQPSGAAVFVDERMKGTTPWTGNKVDAGPHQVRVFLEDYKVEKRTIIVSRGEQNQEMFQLKPTFSTYKVKVVSEGKAIEGAWVKVDQKKVGWTGGNGRLDLGRVSEGERQIQVGHPFYEVYIKSFTVKKGVQKTLTVELSPAYATLSVEVEGNVKSQVTLDGNDLGPAPLRDVRVPSGNMKLRVVPLDQDRFRVFEKKVALGVKEVKRVEANCVARKGKVIITTDPAEADVWVDGVNKGLSPVKLDLFQGEHSLKVRYPKFAVLTKKFQVEEGETLREKVVLSSDPQLVISCSPQGDLFVSGEKVGVDQVVVSRKPGSYKVGCKFGSTSAVKVVRLGSEDRKEVKLRIMSMALRQQEAVRSSKVSKAWTFGVLSGVLAFGSAYLGSVTIPEKVDEQGRAGGAFDANLVWELDDELFILNIGVIALGTGAGVLGILSLYNALSAPPKVELKKKVKGVSARWFVLPTSVGVVGEW